ncbi:MAG: DUF4404 family protein [Pseudomonadales bacterium]|nr:DUF4404 family protein [Pseudomonadales bacterium]MCP5358675.1 DUF4404 family protein [Pseudomonadales bacterium]
MSQEKLRSLLTQLQQEIARGDELDEETLALVRQLNDNVDALIESAEDVNAPVMDDAIALEARFAATHPMAERVLRELIDTLGRIGI